ncbi:hypothetical protein [uncultured Actinomyces sp.]|uniref:hypothetical protein n=1 Tax=uncultured Actinomyces sp. TaxID=249061 RepID=UPI0028EA6FE7|nr:hypothetical protein [uncultured Actinomyces sp.]
MSYSPQYPAAPSGEQAVYPTLAPQDPGASYDAMLRAGAQAPRRSGVEVAAIVLAAVALLLEGVQLFLRTQGVMRNAGPSLVAYILLEFLVDPLIILLVVGLVQGAVRRVNGALAGVVVLAVLRAVLIVLRLATLPGNYTYPYASSDVLAVLACVVATVAGILAVVAAPRLRTPVGAALGAGVAYWLLAASASALISLPLNLTAISSRNFGEQTLEVRMREFLNWAPSFPGSPGLSVVVGTLLAVLLLALSVPAVVAFSVRNWGLLLGTGLAGACVFLVTHVLVAVAMPYTASITAVVIVAGAVPLAVSPVLLTPSSRAWFAAGRAERRRARGGVPGVVPAYPGAPGVPGAPAQVPPTPVYGLPTGAPGAPGAPAQVPPTPVYGLPTGAPGAPGAPAQVPPTPVYGLPTGVPGAPGYPAPSGTQPVPGGGGYPGSGGYPGAPGPVAPGRSPYEPPEWS